MRTLADIADRSVIVGRRTGNSTEAFLKYMAYRDSWLRHMDATTNDGSWKTEYLCQFIDHPESERAK